MATLALQDFDTCASLPTSAPMITCVVSFDVVLFTRYCTIISSQGKPHEGAVGSAGEDADTLVPWFHIDAAVRISAIVLSASRLPGIWREQFRIICCDLDAQGMELNLFSHGVRWRLSGRSSGHLYGCVLDPQSPPLIISIFGILSHRC